MAQHNTVGNLTKFVRDSTDGELINKVQVLGLGTFNKKAVDVDRRRMTAQRLDLFAPETVTDITRIGVEPMYDHVARQWYN